MSLDRILVWDQHRLFGLNVKLPVLLGILNGLNTEGTKIPPRLKVSRGAMEWRNEHKGSHRLWKDTRYGGFVSVFYWHILILFNLA